MRSASRRFILPPGFERTSRTRRARASDGQLARFAQFLHWIAQGIEFHGDIAGIAEVGELAGDIRIVEFAGTGVMASGIVGDVNESDWSDVCLERGDVIARGAWL